MFEKGDRVVYGSNGLCRVDDITKMMFPMETEEHTYYVLRPVNNRNSTLFVPTHKEELTSKMRYIISKEEIDAVISGSQGKEIKWVDDKNARSAVFSSILKSGIPEELLLAIRCIYKRKLELAELGKKLSASDENVLITAEKLVREEFAYALEIAECEVADYIHNKLN